MYTLNRTSSLLTAVIMACIFLASCTSTKQVIYFNDLRDSASIASIKDAKMAFENVIQRNDQLWITVGGSNISDLTMLNSGNGIGVTGASTSVATSGSAAIGYLVESDGKIQLPFIGRIQAAGLTRLQLEEQIASQMKAYTKDPLVNIRFLNYTFSVLGEVNRSGRFNMATERTTILEAISMAGDITDLGRRDNVIVIREENGQRTASRINLLSKSLFSSPYFYLRTNDVIYVEPVKARFISRSGIPQYVSLTAIGLTMILTVINITRK